MFQFKTDDKSTKKKMKQKNNNFNICIYLKISLFKRYNKPDFLQIRFYDYKDSYYFCFPFMRLKDNENIR